MATENFIIDRPFGGAQTVVTLPENETVAFSFGTSDIQGLRLSNTGELVMSFTDGAMLVIDNFSSLVGDGMKVTMSDGTVMDFQTLFQSLASTQSNSAVIEIAQPQNGDVTEIRLENGKTYNISFDPAARTGMEEQDGALLVSFGENGILVLRNFSASLDSETPPSINFNGQFLAMEEFAETLRLADAINDGMDEPSFPQSTIRAASVEEQDVADLAEQLSEIEPAAGEQGSTGNRGGFGFQSSVDAAPLDSPDDVGPIGPTELQFGLPEGEEPLKFIEEEPAAAPNLPPTPILVANDDLVFEDNTVTLDISAYSNAGSTVMTTLTISGIPSSWQVVPNQGTYDAGTGTWTVTIQPGMTFSGGPTLSPPHDSDVDLNNLVVTATNTDNSTGASSSTTQMIDVIVDAVADMPNLNASGSAGDEDTALLININASVGDIDGSEDITTVFLRGIPDGFTLSAGTNNGGGEWQLTSADLAGLTISAPQNFSGSLGLEVEVVAEEVNTSDVEPFLQNNTAKTFGELTVTWAPVADAPELIVNDAQVKEDGNIFIPVEAKLADTDGSEFLTLTVTGLPNGWNLIGTDWNPAGTPGEYSISVTLGSDYNGGFILFPSADSDVDLSGLQITATSTEIENGDEASTTKAIDVIVDAVADDPAITADNTTGNEDTSLDVDISGLLTDTDGSEVIVKYQISGVPSGFSFNQGTDLGAGVWEFTPAELTGLTMSAPADYFGSVNLGATVFTSEDPVTDGEFDGFDNDAQASTEFTMTWKPVIDPPSVEANNGADDAVVKEDGSVFVPITASLNPVDSADAYLTVTVTGIDPAWGVSFTEGAYDAGAGTWSVTLAAGENYNGGLTFSPPADSDADMSGLVATATATEPTSGTSLDATDGFNVVTDAVADTPTVDAEAATGEVGTVIDLDISTAVTDLDGSEEISQLIVTGLPDDAVLSAGTEYAAGSWLLSPAQLTGLTVSVPEGLAGTYELTVYSFAEEVNLSGSEVDFTDNTAMASTTLTLTVTPDMDPEIVNPDTAVVDESDLGPVTYSDALEADFGNDTPGTFSATGTFSSSGSQLNNNLTSGGVPVVVSAVGNTYTGTAGGETIFTLTIDPDTGEYEFNLIGNLDHADSNDPNDVISLVFGFGAEDKDGDTDDSGLITVNVLDDAPEVDNVQNLVIANREGLYEGTVSVSGLADGVESYTLSALNGVVPDGLVYTTYSYGDALTQELLDAGVIAPEEGGSLIVAHLDDSGSTLFFALSIDKAGEYDFNLINENPLIEKDVDLSTVPPGNYPDGIYYDADAKVWTENDPGNAELFISGSGSVNPSGEGIGISNNQFQINETIEFNFTDDVATASISTVRQSGKDSWYLEVKWYAYDGGSEGTLVDEGTVIFSGEHSSYSFSTNLDIEFDTLVLVGLDSTQSNITNDSAKFTISEISYSETFLPDELDLAFDVGVTDGDGDSDSAPLYVTIGSGDQDGFDLSGDNNASYSDDIITGAETSDTLYGGDGADTFLFDGFGGVDTISDFDILEGDSIDVGGLLTEYDPVQDSINDFVFAREENGNTILSVDVNGSGDSGNAVDIAVLETVTGIGVENLLNIDNTNTV